MQLYNWKETIIQIKFKVSAPASEANCEMIFTVFGEISVLPKEIVHYRTSSSVSFQLKLETCIDDERQFKTAKRP